MKRKNKTKKTLRIQRAKEQKQWEKSMATSILIEELRCSRNEYAGMADSPDYFYVYVHRYFGWSLYPPLTIVFLFDIERESVKYAVERDVYSDESPSDLEDNDDDFDSEKILLSVISEIKVSLEVIGEAHFSIKDEMEEMFSWEEPDLPPIYDGGGWVVFLKNGKRKRRICIQDEKYYPPFLWLIRFFDDIVELKKTEKNDQGS
ncbi:MAG: hypothetical protein IKH26_03100 [Bacteroidaceae bacterium]|nr:hypothetical protein [Bacteroidaceae bacterium]